MIGVPAPTIRLWERQGLVRPSRTSSNYRIYSLEEIEHMRRVRDLIQVNGLNVAGVKHVLFGNNGAAAGVRTRTPAQLTEEAELGNEIRSRRQATGISLREFAAATGVSSSYISSVERGISRPSLATLQRIAATLGTNIAAMLGDVAPDPAALVVRRSRRRRVRLATPGIRMEQLASQERVLEPTYVTIAPGAGIDEPYQHEGEEFVYILAGQFELTIEERDTHVLEEGDAITFESRLPHRWRNPGNDEARLIWVNTPPTF